MSKNFENTPNQESDSTELEIKIHKLHTIASSEQPQLNRFYNHHLYSIDEIDRDLTWLSRKEFSFDQESDLHANACESTITYIANHDELFNTPAFAFPGSDYDDKRNGVDLVCGFPHATAEGRDLIFSIDLSTDTLGKSSLKKFAQSDLYSRQGAPSTSQIKYYQHAGRRTRISDAPHYIVGLDPATIINHVNQNFQLTDLSIEHQPDPNINEKILLELYLQSLTGFYASGHLSPEQSSKNTAKVHSAHQTIKDECFHSLQTLYRTETSEDTSKLLNQHLKTLLKGSDSAFRHVCNESIRRYNLEKRKYLARRALQSQS